jgi:hypothetical protein
VATDLEKKGPAAFGDAKSSMSPFSSEDQTADARFCGVGKPGWTITNQKVALVGY